MSELADMLVLEALSDSDVTARYRSAVDRDWETSKT